MFKIKKLLILILFGIFLLPLVSVAASYSNGTLLRASGGIKVYLINNNVKRWVSSLEVFAFNGFKWRDVKIVSKKKLSEIKPSDSEGAVEISAGRAIINDKLPAPDYIRADWLVSDATSNYGRIGRRITFKYSDKEKDKIENFRLYEKKPGEKYFHKIAAFEEMSS
ncbi:MAG: hypothetical protein HYX22_02585, partial [Candidatus Yanofskybacteria bacterium]|nr:hypothetical protein [Candidatus Yanofskybacteria bacterium]